MAYDGARAAAYAAQWWNGSNPQFRYFEDNCTNFVSQCLLAGGWPMDSSGSRSKGWWYHGPHEQWSYSWAVTNSLRWYMENSGRCERRSGAHELQVGDVIYYDWDGDGVWQHATIVVGFDGQEPLVAANTYASYNRPWRYTDSPAYTDQTRYLFWHMKPSWT